MIAGPFHLPTFRAAKDPATTPSEKRITSDVAFNCAVTHILSRMSSHTGAPGYLEIDSPISPCANPIMYSAYCTGIGRLSPSSCRTRSTVSGSARPPVRISTGSPGPYRHNKNVTEVTTNSTGIIHKIRLIIYPPTEDMSSPPYMFRSEERRVGKECR